MIGTMNDGNGVGVQTAVKKSPMIENEAAEVAKVVFP